MALMLRICVRITLPFQMSPLNSQHRKGHHQIQLSAIPQVMRGRRRMHRNPMLQGEEKEKKMKRSTAIRRKKQSKPQLCKISRRLPTATAAPRPPTPPPLFCFFLLRVRLLLLRWWPCESEGERAMHRPHTHSSFTHSLCVSPCRDSRPHLIPRSTHIMCPLHICMHTHAGPLVLSFARHAPLPSCQAAWAEHRNCFCFVSIALSGRPLSLPVCVFCFTGAMRVCALVDPRFGCVSCFLFYCFICVVVESTHSADCVFNDMSNLRACHLPLSAVALFGLSCAAQLLCNYRR
ncbi:hypothetical protein ECC02_010816 [Trypanosoma cruzi]|uniref:Uncharacterized protein n=1 Tax=Trypanosoma cruzi TaxID=5693 RepID=A0A7J6XPN5_TRYCR|nr:hypothetical protein ECC02_010816 [Trypanosoma cruzi]